jgi:hypothetical protein
MNIRLSIAVIKFSFCNYFAAQTVQNSFPRKCIILVWHILINFSTGFFGNSRCKHKKSVCRSEKRGSWKALYQVLFKPQTLREKVIAPSPVFWQLCCSSSLSARKLIGLRGEDGAAFLRRMVG